MQRLTVGDMVKVGHVVCPIGLGVLSDSFKAAKVIEGIVVIVTYHFIDQVTRYPVHLDDIHTIVRYALDRGVSAVLEIFNSVSCRVRFTQC